MPLDQPSIKDRAGTAEPMPTDPAPTSRAPDAASRLDRMIDRLVTQRAFLDMAARLVAGRPGPVLDIGLGKARTYDHLVTLFGRERVWAFDFSLHAPAGAAPPADRLVLGDFDATLQQVRLPGPAVLAHADTGTQDAERDARQSQWLGSRIDALLADGGIVLSDRPLTVDGWQPLDRPNMSGTWPYFAWRVQRGS